MNINFDTAYLSKEEATGLAALMAAINGSLPPMAEMRRNMLGQTALTGGSIGSVVKQASVDAVVDPDGNAPSDAAPPEVTGSRVRGQPAPGKARRTKAEIAEDEAAGTTTQGISTGESRVAPEDDAETQAQDEADEQAEVEAEREPDAPLTTEDLKEAMSAYVTKFGIPATQEDGAKMFADALGKPPAGEAAWKLSLVGAAGQDHIKKAIAVFAKAAQSEARYGA
jgi:hypothetical protein